MIRTDTVSSWHGGQMRCVRLSMGRLELGLGWVTRWSAGIKWLHYGKSPGHHINTLSLGRLRLGFGWRAEKDAVN